MEEKVTVEAELENEVASIEEEIEEVVVKPRRKRPALYKKFDIETAFFSDKEDEEPRFKYNLKGSFKLDIFRALAVAFAAVAGLCALSLFKNKK